MLLSIVMMVKNEEKYLDKTLYALNNLRKDINSELIILDTGSNDNTVQIAKKYTEKVYFAKWNNNFAEMRNISISYASGDWILILDADEQLINYDKLKKFFESNLYKKYNSATIELKNIYDEDKEKNKYSMASIIRMFKNTDEFGYDGAIHEQPKFKKPVYNNIATFEHYGYIYSNEEVRQRKTERNKKLLLEEIEKNPRSPYINYQLGKTYISDLNKSEAIYYMERSFNLYKERGSVPLYLIGDLLNLYVGIEEYTKSECLANKYIQIDKKNIDVYYYLALSQYKLSKYKESIKSYKRYLYLTDNYDLSTQANNMDCICNTIQYKNKCQATIIKIYYKLEMYEKVVENLEELSEEIIKDIYYMIFDSLYKLNNEENILELYKKYPKYDYNKNNFIRHLEQFLRNIKDQEKIKIYRLFSNIEGNYGILNKLRLGQKLSLTEYNNILSDEDEIYYGEILYYALNQGLKIDDILKGINSFKVERYIGYLIINKRNSIFELYKYLDSLKNTLDSSRLCIYSNLCNLLLKYGNLRNDKYEKIFLLYIKYNYDFIKNTYNDNLSDEDIITILKDKNDIFTIKLNILQMNKNKDLLKYISDIKKLVNSHREYKDGINILINKFKNEFNENEELKSLKKQYKSIVENSIQLGNFDEATLMIKEYENMFNKDNDILNMKGIIAMHLENFDEAELLFKESTILEINYNVIFNIAYLKETIGDIVEARKFYERIIGNCEDESIVCDARERIKFLN